MDEQTRDVIVFSDKVGDICASIGFEEPDTLRKMSQDIRRWMEMGQGYSNVIVLAIQQAIENELGNQEG